MRNQRWLNIAYLGLLLLTAPSALWVAFEMYGLTFFLGPQMLFYSVSHTHPTIMSILWLSSKFYLLFLAVNIIVLIFNSLTTRLLISKKCITYILTFQIFHIVALLSYDFWSTITFIRVLVTIFGTFLLFFVIAKLSKKPLITFIVLIISAAIGAILFYYLSYLPAMEMLE